jgi:8-amino-7-oxononanoate synthase
MATRLMSGSHGFEYLQARLNELKSQHRLRQLSPRVTHRGMIVESDGTELVNFGGNDYLGLAQRRTAELPEQKIANGSQASALVCGWTPKHQQLAEVIAEFESTEAAVVFPSGFAACSGTIATLAESGDLILSDELNHASLIDGCRLSRAECLVYPHRDVACVEEILRSRRDDFQRFWIVTDGVFSMDGHCAPLSELAELAQRHDAYLIVDEAHGTGVLGEQGSGVCEALGVKSQVAVRIGTLSKAIGTQGGFVCGPQTVIDYLVNRCRSLIYSTALAPASVQSALAAFDAIRKEPQLREHVIGLSRRLRSRLNIQVSEIESGVPIIPILMGSDEAAVSASSRLRKEGYYVPAIRPPTVPDGEARLRVSLSAAHSAEMVDALGEVLTRI